MTEGIKRRKKKNPKTSAGRVRERMKATKAEEVTDGDATWGK